MNKKGIIGISAILIVVAGYFIIDSLLFDGIKPRVIDENEFHANFYSSPETENKTTVVLIGGGQWGEYWGAEIAKNGFVGLSIPYTNVEGLPELPEEIPIEYFENAIKWIGQQPEVNPGKIVVMGASRNAELALVIASSLPELVSGVIAYAPSSVSWANTVLPYNSDEMKPGWTYRGEAIPYVPMNKISGGDSNTINTLKYWEEGLNKEEFVKDAAIKVEKIKGPVLMFSGKDDQVWPSSQMADLIETRLEENNFEYQFKNMQYDDAGHLISGNPESNSEARTGTMTIHGNQYSYDYGGTNAGDFKAKQNARSEVMKLIKNL
ncbi:acyl-CoA thioester hydrolase/BAAT C-terminal domain-containing protein [Salegentibacter sp. F188]|uniref:Acyl-CoA thioester hydrolase/BAAT C-terminal domain-containing protein n=1 Tax=Autumnicola patrickiae TaxID=3075591 RepID=A0ABU3E3R7_9FLAO|nr:acyl-CoA thioester hydrolase/BAAT C-terminal domain-containing protein [Salegentibacter sp. F188]MDT0690633.1 acyl-CoA thioester hydrolase/BAAT C-terminal domain-containing protein [Salegentibacter sp. F188]